MIEIHTQGWKEDHAVTGDEKPSASIYCRVFIDGVELPQVVRARTQHNGSDFGLTVLTLCDAVEIVNHTRDSWKELS